MTVDEEQFRKNWQEAALDDVRERREWGQRSDSVRMKSYPIPVPRPSPTVVLAKWMIFSVVGVLLLWGAVDFTLAIRHEQQTRQRIDACVQSMMDDSRDAPACKGLSQDEKQKAAYEYVKKAGLL